VDVGREEQQTLYFHLKISGSVYGILNQDGYYIIGSEEEEWHQFSCICHRGDEHLCCMRGYLLMRRMNMQEETVEGKTRTSKERRSKGRGERTPKCVQIFGRVKKGRDCSGETLSLWR
jgi:hypothetical protein